MAPSSTEEGEDFKYSYLDLVKAVDNFPETAPTSHLYKLYIGTDPRPHGWMLAATVARMPWTKDFHISHEEENLGVRLLAPGQSYPTSSNPTKSEHSEASAPKHSEKVISPEQTQKVPPPTAEELTFYNHTFQTIINTCIDEDIFPVLHKSHSEDFRIPGVPGLHIERYTAPLFGITSRGAHLTVWTRVPSEEIPAGEIKIYTAIRSRAPGMTYPGKLDSTVAGGVRADQSPSECIVQEADEEASLPSSLVSSEGKEGVKERGCWRYVNCGDGQVGDLARADGVVEGGVENLKKGLFSPTELSIFDMYLDYNSEYKPKPKDDEVEGFKLMGIKECADSIRRGEWKDNSAVVLLEFLVRWGLFLPEKERANVGLVRGVDGGLVNNHEVEDGEEYIGGGKDEFQERVFVDDEMYREIVEGLERGLPFVTE